MVHSWRGAMKYQLARTNAATLAPNAGHTPPGAATARWTAERCFALRLLARDGVHVDRPRGADHAVDHRAPGELRPPRAAAGPQEELRRVLGSRELDERLADVVPDDLR